MGTTRKQITSLRLQRKNCPEFVQLLIIFPALRLGEITRIWKNILATIPLFDSSPAANLDSYHRAGATNGCVFLYRIHAVISCAFCLYTEKHCMINFFARFCPLWRKLFFRQPDLVPISNDLRIFDKANGLSDKI